MDSFYRELVWAATFTNPKEPAEVIETTKNQCIFEDFEKSVF